PPQSRTIGRRASARRLQTPGVPERSGGKGHARVTVLTGRDLSSNGRRSSDFLPGSGLWRARTCGDGSAELRYHPLGEEAHRALDLGAREHRALVEPPDDLGKAELLLRALQAIHHLRGVTEHGLVPAELVVRQVRDRVADVLQPGQMVAVGVGKARE